MARGYDWKAHHRETNNLLGIYWDFDQDTRLPIIAGTFFSNTLTEEDWGKIVQPKEGGGRTTSVSIMQKSGIYKMYKNWITVKSEKAYGEFFDKRNKDDLFSGSDTR